MGGLRDIIEAFESGDAVRGAAIVGEDGLVIHDALFPGTDSDAVAELAVTTMRHAEQFGGAGGSRPPQTMDWSDILAGGSATRFWPHSSPHRPKHLLPLAGARSTAEETVERLTALVPRSRILVVTGQATAAALGARP